MGWHQQKRIAGLAFVQVLIITAVQSSHAQPQLEPEELVQAAGTDIAVPGYSVPSYVDWDGDQRLDLVIGEGGGGVTEARIRVYLNTGTRCDPQFEDYFYVQSDGADLILPGGG